MELGGMKGVKGTISVPEGGCSFTLIDCQLQITELKSKIH